MIDYDNETGKISILGYALAKNREFSDKALRDVFLSQAMKSENIDTSDKKIYDNYMTTVLPEERLHEPAAEVYIGAKKKYKPVALKVRPVYTELPEKFRILRNIVGDPLQDMPQLSTNPQEFEPTGRYTTERKEAFDAAHNGNFLLPEERKLLHELMMKQNQAFAWDDTEKGKFREDFFPPIVIPTVEHTPWVFKNIPIPPGLYERLCEIIKAKLASGVYEKSNSSYRSRWFAVIKKDGKSLRIVHSLEPLNAVTIAHSGVPPGAEELAIHFCGRACVGLCDLFVGYDERLLDIGSRDLTTFQTPFGAMRLTTLPMGWTNSVPIFHDDVVHILQDEIPEYTNPYIDDVGIRGPVTRYEDKDGNYEMIPENPGIRKFVWEHMQNANRIVQRMKYCGGTFSGVKSIICAAEVEVVGHTCSYEGRKPSTNRVQVILDWGPLKDVSDVRSFYGTCGVLRAYITRFADRAKHIHKLMRKGVPFEWGSDQEKSMQLMKEGVRDAQCLKPIDYHNQGDVVLAVDTSYIAVGWYIYQEDKDDPKKRNYTLFGSEALQEHEARYSQPKRELFGLKHALEKNRKLLIGARKLIVETDAKYIAGMLRNPDLMPNATINRWIEQISMYHFTLRHVPGKTFGPDGLSRRYRQLGDPPLGPEGLDEMEPDEPLNIEIVDEALPLPLPVEDFRTEIDNRGGYLQQTSEPLSVDSFLHMIEIEEEFQGLAHSVDDFKEDLVKADELREAERTSLEEYIEKYEHEIGIERVGYLQQLVSTLVLPDENEMRNKEVLYPEDHRTSSAIEQDERLSWVRKWQKDRKYRPANLNDRQYHSFLRLGKRFLMYNGRLYRRGEGAKHRLVIDKNRRMYMLTAAHDHVGHRGFYATNKLLAERFWWPEMEKDVNWFVKTCHNCQERQKRLIRLKPVITHTPSLFQTMHADTLRMSPASNGCAYIVHGRCALSTWMEARALRHENGRTIGQWLWEDIICRWACLVEIVTDNGGPFLAAIRWLEEKYGIKGIAISAYNSKANGIIERPHWDVRQMLYKTLGADNVSKWYWFLPYIMWADRVTVRKRLGCSPFFMVTGANPILPLDVKEATWLVKPPTGIMSDEDLIAFRAQALAKHKVHIDAMRKRINDQKYEALLRYEKDYKSVITEYSFKPGDLVLVRNTAVEQSLDRKMKPRYLGPMIVIRRTKGGSYIVSEMNGAVLHNKIGAFRVLPYYAREKIDIPKNILEIIDISVESLQRIEDGPEDIEPLSDLALGNVRLIVNENEKDNDES